MCKSSGIVHSAKQRSAASLCPTQRRLNTTRGILQTFTAVSHEQSTSSFPCNIFSCIICLHIVHSFTTSTNISVSSLLQISITDDHYSFPPVECSRIEIIVSVRRKPFSVDLCPSPSVQSINQANLWGGESICSIALTHRLLHHRLYHLLQHYNRHPHPRQRYILGYETWRQSVLRRVEAARTDLP